MNEETLRAIARQLRKPEGEQGIQVGKKMNEGNQYINRNTIEQLKIASGDNILEVGMGNGFFVNEIITVDPSVQYTGVDFSPVMVEEAQQANARYIDTRQVSFHLATADTLPFNEHTFNKIFTINTLYFWEDYVRTFNELRRVLKPNGNLIISVRPKSNMINLPFTQYGFNMFSKEDMVKLLDENHFKVENIIEKKEPAQTLDGREIAMESLIVAAVPLQ